MIKFEILLHKVIKLFCFISRFRLYCGLVSGYCIYKYNFLSDFMTRLYDHPLRIYRSRDVTATVFIFYLIEKKIFHVTNCILIFCYGLYKTKSNISLCSTSIIRKTFENHIHTYRKFLYQKIE